MKLKTLLNIKNGEVISIVGAGGKTSLMFTLAEELRADNKVMVTTTTKIYVPESSQYDFIAMEKVDGLVNFYKNNENGIYVVGAIANKDNKIEGIDEGSLKISKDYFDYILIEADGSKTKPLKGWNDLEPVIAKDTTITIGVLDINSLGMEINEENVHRLEKFLELTGAKANEKVNLHHLKNLIFSPRGLFKNSRGKRVLFINKVENIKNLYLAEKLAEGLISEKVNLIDKVIIGSLKYNNSLLYFEGNGRNV